jgi:hypothetical protein
MTEAISDFLASSLATATPRRSRGREGRTSSIKHQKCDPVGLIIIRGRGLNLATTIYIVSPRLLYCMLLYECICFYIAINRKTCLIVLEGGPDRGEEKKSNLELEPTRFSEIYEAAALTK